MCKDVNPEIALYFRNSLRQARTITADNPVNYQEILFALERLGAYLTEKEGTLGTFEKCIKRLVKLHHPLRGFPKRGCPLPTYHISFGRLYDIVLQGRNSALHQGAVANNLPTRCARLSIILEDTMANIVRKGKGQSVQVKDYMVDTPVTTALWHPVSFIRQTMLESSFTYIPYFDSGSWYVVSDRDIADFLWCDGTYNSKKAKRRMSRTLEELVESSQLDRTPLSVVSPKDSIESAFEAVMRSGPPMVAVVDRQHIDTLLGIVTAFDIL